MTVEDPVLARFTEALSAGRLDLPRCTGCGALVWYPRARCPHCMSDRLEWEALSGAGTVYSYTVNRRGQGKYTGADPFVIAYVELAEGPRVLARLDGTPDVGLPVRFTRGLDDEGQVRLTFERDPRVKESS
ncbi:Zn-ribbon domain-containing OB-fold protein [Amycolatopsis sp. RTGN1]|uniref:Zn-ribbon domain-containing OB-fold protein n=1 Tax=Amycolatopsis ponsaeliensis TaxID=2992142 RepID=UPI002550E683|nr:OB-fold domain-containing protein [Amycolatopsis sp. RTGN1]